MISATRAVAAVAATGAAALYFLIGLGVLWIGDSTTGEATDLLSFGVTMGALFAVVALVAFTFGGEVGEHMTGLLERWMPRGDWRDFEASQVGAGSIAGTVQGKHLEVESR